MDVGLSDLTDLIIKSVFKTDDLIFNPPYDYTPYLQKANEQTEEEEEEETKEIEMIKTIDERKKESIPKLEQTTDTNIETEKKQEEKKEENKNIETEENKKTEEKKEENNKISEITETNQNHFKEYKITFNIKKCKNVIEEKIDNEEFLTFIFQNEEMIVEETVFNIILK
jgi:hypothetical protein